MVSGLPGDFGAFPQRACSGGGGLPPGWLSLPRLLSLSWWESAKKHFFCFVQLLMKSRFHLQITFFHRLWTWGEYSQTQFITLCVCAWACACVCVRVCVCSRKPELQAEEVTVGPAAWQLLWDWEGQRCLWCAVCPCSACPCGPAPDASVPPCAHRLLDSISPLRKPLLSPSWPLSLLAPSLLEAPT